MERRITYDIADVDLQPRGVLPDLVTVGLTYNFHRTPTRSPANLGDDRNVCRRINSISASSLALYYDDFFGTGPRREQIFLYSISTPRCDVINFEPAWIDGCVADAFAGNASACFEYMLLNFDDLKHDRTIQVGDINDFGVIGSPFLKCRERPPVPFQFLTDHLVLQTFWAGEEYHVELQSSACWAKPKAIGVQERSALFGVEPADQTADVVIAVPPPHWLVQCFASLCALTTLGFVVRGLVAVVVPRHCVRYVPWIRTKATRSRWRVPSVELELGLVPVDKRFQVVDLFGTFTTASNLWMNHWVYITISIAFSATSIRTLYALFEVGTWMVSQHVSLENFLFVCTALTKLTWLTCLAHTALREILQACLRAAAVVYPRGRRVYATARWYVDAAALLMNFKIYSVLLVIQLCCLVHWNGSTTVMIKRPGFKRPVYGGDPGLASMWGSEIACDLLVICGIQLVAGHVVASALLLTRLRAVTTNDLMCTLQRRYFFVGWDVYVTMDALGIDPFHYDTIRGLVTTDCTMAALVRQLYASGPSGWVRLAGERAFYRADATVSSSKHWRSRESVDRTASSTRQLDGVVVPIQQRFPHSRPTTCASSFDSGENRVDHLPVLQLHIDSFCGVIQLTNTQEKAIDKASGDAPDVLTLLGREKIQALVKGELRLRIC